VFSETLNYTEAGNERLDKFSLKLFVDFTGRQFARSCAIDKGAAQFPKRIWGGAVAEK
jgi:hypothetical protein